MDRAIFEKVESINDYSSFINSEWPNKGTTACGGEELTILSPLRNDKSEGSIKINKSSGLWVDNVDKDKYNGDLVTLVAQSRNIKPLEAARVILQYYGINEDDPIKVSQKKPAEVEVSENLKPMFPIPKEFKKDAIISLNKIIRECRHEDEEWSCEALHKDPDGNIVYASIRYDKIDSTDKRVLFLYYSKGKKWVFNLKHVGDLAKTHLYNIEKVKANPESPIVIVEGTIKAQLEIPPFIPVSFGSTGDVLKRDYSLLKDREVFYWPDADEPGYKTLPKIIEKVPHVKILNVFTRDRPKGWDIKDAEESGSGVDLAEYIRTSALLSHEDAIKPYSNTAQAQSVTGQPHEDINTKQEEPQVVNEKPSSVKEKTAQPTRGEGQEQPFSIDSLYDDFENTIQFKCDPWPTTDTYKILNGDKFNCFRDGLFVFGGEANAGKTSIATDSSMALLLENPDSALLFYSLDDPKAMSGKRILSQLDSKPHMKSSPEGMRHLKEKKRSVISRTFIRDNLVITELLRDANYIKAVTNSKKIIIIIDYLQIVSNDSNESTFEFLNSTVKYLKETQKVLAEEGGCILFCLSQLNRDSKSTGYRYRGTSEIENQADVCIDIKLVEDNRENPERILEISKNKLGIRSKFKTKIYEWFEFRKVELDNTVTSNGGNGKKKQRTSTETTPKTKSEPQLVQGDLSLGIEELVGGIKS